MPSKSPRTCTCTWPKGVWSSDKQHGDEIFDFLEANDHVSPSRK